MPGLLELLLPYTPYLALILRVWVGANFVGHGYPKISKAREQTLQAMKALGVPRGVTILAAILEFLGGLSLIIGFIVPIVAFFIALEMIAATILKKTKMKAVYLAGQNPVSYELDITYLLLALTLLVLGAGALSIDSLIGF